MDMGTDLQVICNNPMALTLLSYFARPNEMGFFHSFTSLKYRDNLIAKPKEEAYIRSKMRAATLNTTWKARSNSSNTIYSYSI